MYLLKSKKNWREEVMTHKHSTIDWEFFAVEIFRRLNFSPGFIFVTMITPQYKLTPFIRAGKYFAGLIFVVEDDCGRLFRNKNFSIYDSF